MPRLSALAYPNNAPIYGLIDMRLAYCQRILGGTLALAPRTDTQHHNFGHTNALTATKLRTCTSCRCQSVLLLRCRDKEAGCKLPLRCLE
jgi:hypothetical protein